MFEYLLLKSIFDLFDVDLVERSKKLRRAICVLDESMKDAFPPKPVTDVIEDEIKYCQQPIQVPKLATKVRAPRFSVAKPISQ